MTTEKPRRAALGVLLAGLLMGGVASASPAYRYEPMPQEVFTPLPTPLLEDRRTAEPVLSVIVESDGLGPGRPSTTPRRPSTLPTAVAKAETETSGSSGARGLTGKASWYCLPGRSRCTRGYGGGMYAAIRRDLLYLRGRTVDVCTTSRCIRVTIIDCNCGPNANLIDLYSDAFRQLAPLSQGVVQVTVRP